MNRHRNLSFYIESLILLLFLLAALVVLLRVFGAAQSLGWQAREKTDAALILQTVSAEFSAQAEPVAQGIREARQSGEAHVEYRCDSQGTVREDGSYRVVVRLRAEPQTAGNLVIAEIHVAEASAQNAESLATMETSLYCPNPAGEEAES